MIGNNSLLICQKQMIDAMQYWLENVVFKDTAKQFEVVGVYHLVQGEHSGSFEIKLNGLEEDA